MGKYKTLDKFVAYDGNPFMAISQNAKGYIFGHILEHKFDSFGKEIPKRRGFQFHFSREGPIFHWKYFNEKGKSEFKNEIRTNLEDLKTEEKLVEFLLTETTAKRLPINKKTSPVILDLTPSKYGKKIMLVTIWLNRNKPISENKDWDVVTDSEFSKPITILVQRWFREIHITPNGLVMV